MAVIVVLISAGMENLVRLISKFLGLDIKDINFKVTKMGRLRRFFKLNLKN